MQAKLFSMKFLQFLPDQIKQHFVNEDDWSILEIEIKIYDISWLNSDGEKLVQADKFLQHMASKGTQKMFAYELFDALLYEQYYTHHLLFPFGLYILMVCL